MSDVMKTIIAVAAGIGIFVFVKYHVGISYKEDRNVIIYDKDLKKA